MYRISRDFCVLILYPVLVFFFPAYFTLYNWLQFHPSHQNWFKWILFNGWVILQCVYVPLLSYSLVCRWTSTLLSCPGYYKQCCDEHRGTHVSFNSGFLRCMPRIEIAGSYGDPISRFQVFSTLFSIVAVLVCIPTNSVRGFPLLHTLSSTYCL